MEIDVNDIRKRIGEAGDKLDKVFNLLEEQIEEDYKYELTQHKGRYSTYKGSVSNAISSHKDLELTINSIRQGLLGFLKSYEEDQIRQSLSAKLLKSPYTNKLYQFLDVLCDESPHFLGSVRDDLFFMFFVGNRIDEDEINSIKTKRRTRSEKQLAETVRNKVRSAVPVFFKRLLSHAKSAENPVTVKNLLKAFYYCWKAIKVIYPEQNFMERSHDSEVFVKLFRYRKINNPDQQFDLSYQEFSDADFSGLFLKNDCFDYCKFYDDTSFSNSILQMSSFKYASFNSNGEDGSVQTPSVDFSGARIQSCYFQGCSGQSIDFSNTVLEDCHFESPNDNLGSKTTDLSQLIGQSSKWKNCNMSGAIFSDSSFVNSRFELIKVNGDTTLFDVDFEGADLAKFDTMHNSAELIASVFSKAKSLFRARLSNEVRKAIILNAESPDTLRQLLLDKVSLEAYRNEENDSSENDEKTLEEKHLEHLEKFPNIDHIKTYQSITEDSLNAREIIHDWLQKKIRVLEDRLALYPSLPGLEKSELEIFLDNLIQEIEVLKKCHSPK